MMTHLQNVNHVALGKQWSINDWDLFASVISFSESDIFSYNRATDLIRGDIGGSHSQVNVTSVNV